MRRRPPQSLPPPLESGRQRFEHWRNERQSRSRIPEPLWEMAVELAEAFGVHRTARALRLNYDALKTRVLVCQGVESAPAAVSAARFVELTAPASPAAGRCTVEFDEGHGARMRVELEHAEASVVSALANAWLQSRSR